MNESSIAPEFEIKPSFDRALLGACVAVPLGIFVPLCFLSIIQIVACGWRDLRHTHTWYSLQALILLTGVCGICLLLDYSCRRMRWVVISQGIQVFRGKRLVEELSWVMISRVDILPFAIKLQPKHRWRPMVIHYANPICGERMRQLWKIALSANPAQIT